MRSLPHCSKVANKILTMHIVHVFVIHEKDLSPAEALQPRTMFSLADAVSVPSANSIHLQLSIRRLWPLPRDVTNAMPAWAVHLQAMIKTLHSKTTSRYVALKAEHLSWAFGTG